MPILNWLGKDKYVHHHQQVPYRVLLPQHTHGQADSGNMIVHGDNLDALKSLLPRYEGKVKCVYIDPPYNTGNEGWVYNDNVNDPRIREWLKKVVGKEGEDLSRHDKWLCMMYPRLKLLQRLLAEDGAIFISIDDNEQASLKLLCDEIFGSGNFLCAFAWEKRYSPPPDTKDIGYLHETLLAYRRAPAFKRNLLSMTDDQTGRYKNPDGDPRGSWQSMDYTCRFTADERPNLYYPIRQPSTQEEIWPKRTRVWAMSREVHERNECEDRIWWGTDGKNTVPRLKNFLSEIQQGMMPVSLLKHEVVGHTDEAAKELRSLLPDLKFTPKPTRLIRHLLEIATDKDSLILDSFAGSGTTAHAVLNMNKNDRGNRKFILVEMEDYAETITAERIKRVIDGYGNTEGTGGGFAYYELGDRLLFEDGNLNESLAIETIREYVWYTETKADYAPQEEQYLLGIHLSTAYYFYYEKQRVTVLDHDFLRNVKTEADRYHIYADMTTLSAQEMDAANIRFKKIPRDITKL